MANSNYPRESYNSLLDKMNKSENRKFLYGLAVFAIIVIAIVVVPTVLLKNSQDLRQQAASTEIEQAASPDQILVRFTPDTSKIEQDNILSANNLTVEEELPQISVLVLQVPSDSRDDVLEKLSRNPSVEFAEKNILAKPEVIPNDPSYSSQWHLPKIKAPEAWDITKSNVQIGICDTGVNDVPDLASSLRSDLSWNTVDNSNNRSDDVGHGTRIAGIASAITNNGVGVAAVGWGSQIIPVKISNLPDGSAYSDDAAKCIIYTADRGAKAVNLSYLMGNSMTINAAGLYLQEKGGLLTVAAGNNSLNPGWKNLPGIISVSATNQDDTLAEWSNYGNYIDISAPGDSIWTTFADGSYSATSGTSVASPIVAGVIALIYGANPQITATEAQNVLLQNTTDLGGSGWDQQFGWGLVNAENAVKSVSNN